MFYRKETYLRAYSNMMKPMNGPKFWKKLGLAPSEPPKYRKMPGRPPKNRKKEEWEGSSGNRLSRKGRVMTCQVCFQKGHDKKTCPILKNSKKKHVMQLIQPRNLQLIDYVTLAMSLSIS